MTGGALIGAGVEKGFAGFGIARDDVGRGIAGAAGARANQGFGEALLQEVGHVGDLGAGEGGAGFAAQRGVAFLEEGEQEVAVAVMHEEFGADEICAFGGAAGFGAVATDAFGVVDGGTAVGSCVVDHHFFGFGSGGDGGGLRGWGGSAAAGWGLRAEVEAGCGDEGEQEE